MFVDVRESRAARPQPVAIRTRQPADGGTPTRVPPSFTLLRRRGQRRQGCRRGPRRDERHVARAGPVVDTQSRPRPAEAFQAGWGYLRALDAETPEAYQPLQVFEARVGDPVPCEREVAEIEQALDVRETRVGTAVHDQPPELVQPRNARQVFVFQLGFEEMLTGRDRGEILVGRHDAGLPQVSEVLLGRRWKDPVGSSQQVGITGEDPPRLPAFAILERLVAEGPQPIPEQRCLGVCNMVAVAPRHHVPHLDDIGILGTESSRPDLQAAPQERLRIVEPPGIDGDVAPLREHRCDLVIAGSVKTLENGLESAQPAIGLGPILPLPRCLGERVECLGLGPAGRGLRALLRGEPARQIPSASPSRSRTDASCPSLKRDSAIRGSLGFRSFSRIARAAFVELLRLLAMSFRLQLPFRLAANRGLAARRIEDGPLRKEGRRRVGLGLGLALRPAGGSLGGVDAAQAIEQVGCLRTIRSESLIPDGQGLHQFGLGLIVLLADHVPTSHEL